MADGGPSRDEVAEDVAVFSSSFLWNECRKKVLPPPSFNIAAVTKYCRVLSKEVAEPGLMR